MGKQITGCSELSPSIDLVEALASAELVSFTQKQNQARQNQRDWRYGWNVRTSRRGGIASAEWYTLCPRPRVLGLEKPTNIIIVEQQGGNEGTTSCPSSPHHPLHHLQNHILSPPRLLRTITFTSVVCRRSAETRRRRLIPTLPKSWCAICVWLPGRRGLVVRVIRLEGRLLVRVCLGGGRLSVILGLVQVLLLAVFLTLDLLG